MSSANQQVEETDRLLDELDVMARSNASNHRFFDQVLTSLRLFVSAQSASILAAVPPKSWIEIVKTGQSSNEAFNELVAQLEHHNPDTHPSFIKSDGQSSLWFAVPSRADGFSSGCLLLTFSPPIPSSGLAAIEAISRAFAEVLSVRHFSRLEQMLGKNWARIQTLNQQLADTKSLQAASEILVNQLVTVFSASRISFATFAPFALDRAKMLAISSTPHIERGNSIVQSLEKVALATLLLEKPVIHQEEQETSQVIIEHQISADGTFKNLLGLKFYSHGGRPSAKQKSAIILEWCNREEMLDALPGVTQFLPMLCFTWEQHDRWLQVPKIARVVASHSLVNLVPAVLRGLLRPIVLAVAALLAFWFLNKPFPMTIEADSTLEPVSKRAVYANVDGYLEQLLVEDGQSVVQGQPVAKLRSPTLDLQIEEADGQIRAIGEKRNGLRVAINQVSPSSPDAEVVQTRISAEILLLETQEKHVRDKWKFLTQEQKKLSIESPIEGVIVSRNLRSELESRPLRRGDTLFNIVNLEGDWQLSIRVADRDLGYVMRSYGTNPKSITFVFDSIPGEQFQGEVRQVSTTMENPQGAGSFLQVYAQLDRNVAHRAYMGANARVSFNCGVSPLWFVWCRPMIESIQKRFWYLSPNNVHIQK